MRQSQRHKITVAQETFEIVGNLWSNPDQSSFGSNLACKFFLGGVCLLQPYSTNLGCFCFLCQAINHFIINLLQKSFRSVALYFCVPFSHNIMPAATYHCCHWSTCESFDGSIALSFNVYFVKCLLCLCFYV